jgi:hypothetical protein
VTCDQITCLTAPRHRRLARPCPTHRRPPSLCSARSHPSPRLVSTQTLRPTSSSPDLYSRSASSGVGVPPSSLPGLCPHSTAFSGHMPPSSMPVLRPHSTTFGGCATMPPPPALSACVPTAPTPANLFDLFCPQPDLLI